MINTQCSMNLEFAKSMIAWITDCIRELKRDNYEEVLYNLEKWRSELQTEINKIETDSR